MWRGGNLAAWLSAVPLLGSVLQLAIGDRIRWAQLGDNLAAQLAAVPQAGKALQLASGDPVHRDSKPNP